MAALGTLAAEAISGLRACREFRSRIRLSPRVCGVTWRLRRRLRRGRTVLQSFFYSRWELKWPGAMLVGGQAR
jgi:hypothetical protein